MGMGKKVGDGDRACRDGMRGNGNRTGGVG